MSSSNKSSLRTDRSRVRYLGAARSGTRAMWHMRLTSMALVPLTILFVWLVLKLAGGDYAYARATLANPWWALVMLLFLLTGVYHMEIGMRSIIDDYLHERHTKEWALAANLFFAVAIGLACVYSVLKIGFA